ncbi:hypothetical protein [Streptomyces sp. NPDC008092]|uniref:hypothetical protein n=1 Tax=Streptomyces sp. NPDC008092 TaxID=3364808 RepID=UPI0036EF972C
MTNSLSEFLTEHRADRETILQAARYSIAELSDDLPVAEMRAELDQNYAQEAQAAATKLRSSPLELTDDALAILSWLWYDQDQEETVRQAVANAQTKLPVIEISVIVSAVLYGLHLWQTKGVKRTYHRIETKSDGTFVETVETENFSPGLSLRLGQSDKKNS